jgi:activator of HSP90 ATPase
VQNREDGRNVNSWHWEEKNVLPWAKQCLEELATAIPPREPGGLCIKRLKSCSGEASITTRKGGKRLAIWDLQAAFEWAATADGKTVKGSIEVKEVSSAHDDLDDVVFEVSADGGAEAHKAAAAALKPDILAALAEFGRRLHALEK